LVPSTGKAMASVFWDAEGIFFIDYLEKGKTITGEYNSNLLTRLGKKIHEERPGLQKKKSSFIRTMHPPTKLFWQWENYGFCTINCWNIPDLAPSDFSLFPKLKLFLAGQRFSLNQEAIPAVEGYFAYLTKNHNRDRIMALDRRWN
jgi:histone-lysine N-methyltransferase SETMAR